MRPCVGCGEPKPESEFYASGGRNRGLKRRCIACVRADARARYWRNRDRYKAAALARWRAGGRCGA